MPSFDEVLLPSDIDRGAKGGPAWSTQVVVTSSGAEQRTAMWSRPRLSFDVGHSLKTIAQYDALLSFFIARQGRLRGFRFLDWSDYSSAIAGVETKHNLATITSTTFQLQKGYVSGGVTLYRKIAKPIATSLGNTTATQANSTIKVYNGVTEITSGWTCDTTTGIVTFGSAPGYTPSAIFQYHIPVRFDEDALAASIDEVTYRSLRIRLIELLV